jgi:hypothetical protein
MRRGLSFQSTEETTFPGFDKPVPKGQIICSCPITTAKPGTSTAGYQIMGPYPCDKSWFKYCKSITANGNTGSTIYVGAPIGAPAGLAAALNGKAPRLLTNAGPNRRTEVALFAVSVPASPRTHKGIS